MDITKLMIGDWVWCGSNYGKVAEIFILHDSLLITVNNRRNKYFEEVNPFEITTGAEDIRPIPLTQEILEKNGFESYSHESNLIWGIKTAEGHWVLAYMDYYWSFTMDCTIYRRIKIQYVHELQHALKLCGIEKEITL